MEKEEELIALHMNNIKENAKLLTKEGDLLSYVQENEDYDIEEYVEKLQKIISSKIQMYMHMKEQIRGFKEELKEEEETHRRTIEKFGVKKQK